MVALVVLVFFVFGASFGPGFVVWFFLEGPLNFAALRASGSLLKTKFSVSFAEFTPLRYFVSGGGGRQNPGPLPPFYFFACYVLLIVSRKFLRPKLGCLVVSRLLPFAPTVIFDLVATFVNIFAFASIRAKRNQHRFPSVVVCGVVIFPSCVAGLFL